MKIAIVTTYSFGATLNRVISIINALQGNEIHLFGACDESVKKNKSLKNHDFEVHYIPLKKKVSKNFLIRFLSEFKYSLKCSLRLKELNADREIISIPYSSLIITSALFHGSKSRKIIDIRDLVWEYLSEQNWLEKLVKTIFKKTHLYFLRQFDHIVVTNSFEQKILSENIKKKDITILSNGISQHSFNTLREVDTLSDLEVTYPINITYVGNVGLLQNLSSFINVIKDLRQFKFIIVGDGNDFDNIKKLIREDEIKNVELTGRLDYNELLPYYRQTHFLYAKLDPNIKSAVPSKLFEYLAIGKPLIYSGKGAAIEVLGQFKNVVVCEDEQNSIQSILNHILRSEFHDSNSNIELIRKKYIREQIYKKFSEL